MLAKREFKRGNEVKETNKFIEKKSYLNNKNSRTIFPNQIENRRKLLQVTSNLIELICILLQILILS